MSKEVLWFHDLAVVVMNSYSKTWELVWVTRQQVANLLQSWVLQAHNIYDSINLYLTPKIQSLFLDIYNKKKHLKEISHFEKILLAYGFFFSIRKKDLRKFLNSSRCDESIKKFFREEVLRNYEVSKDFKDHLFLAFKTAVSFDIIIQQYDKNLPFKWHSQTLWTSDSGIWETFVKRSGNKQTQTFET